MGNIFGTPPNDCYTNWCKLQRDFGSSGDLQNDVKGWFSTPANNAFKCNWDFKSAPFNRLNRPEDPACSWVAKIEAFGITLSAVVIGALALIFGGVILTAGGIGIDVAANAGGLGLAIISYITSGFRFLLTGWVWLYNTVSNLTQTVATATGINALLLWITGVEVMAGLTLLVLQNVVRLYWDFNNSSAYPIFHWLNTPLRWLKEKVLQPNFGWFLSDVIELLLLFPLEIPIMAIAVVGGAIRNLWQLMFPNSV